MRPLHDLYATIIHDRRIYLYSPPPSQPVLAGLYLATGSKLGLTNPDQLAGRTWPGITRIAKDNSAFGRDRFRSPPEEAPSPPFETGLEGCSEVVLGFG
jgi:hypothetical protein